MGGFGAMPGRVHHFLGVADEGDRRYGLARSGAETRRLYGVADRRSAQVEFSAGELSIADFANVERWYGAMMARPAVERGFAVALS